MADDLKGQLGERDAEHTKRWAQKNYRLGFGSAYSHALHELGEAHGAAAAAGVIPESPDPEDLARCTRDYRTAFTAAFAYALRQRGEMDGKAAAEAIGVEELSK